MRRRIRSLAIFVLGAGIVILLVGACGSTGSPGPAGGAATAPSNTSATPAAAGGSKPETAPASETALTEVATDNKFSAVSYTIMAGTPYTLTLQNKGEALHNWHILGVKGTDGKDVDSPLADGGRSVSFTFTAAKAGTYRFQCDVHPDEMKGSVTVQ